MRYWLRYISPRIADRKVCFLHHLMSFYTSCAAQSLDFYEDCRSQESKYDELTKSMLGHAASGCLRGAVEDLCMMRSVPSKPTISDYNSMIYCYLKSEHVSFDELLEVHKGLRYGPSPNALTYKILLNGMVSLGRLRHGICIIKEMCDCGFKPSFTCLSQFLKRLIQVGNLVDSLWLLELMLRFSYVPTEPTLNMLIHGLSKAGMVREAYFAFCVLLDSNLLQCAYSFNPIMWTFAKFYKNVCVLAFFCILKKKGLVLDERSYTALVYGYCREGLWNDAFHCLDKMEADGFKPNTISFTVLLKFLCDQGKVEEAINLLETMENKGCYPDLVTYNIVLRELCLQNKTVEIDDLLLLIHWKGFAPDPYTCSAFAGGMLKRGKIEIAKKFLLDNIWRGCSVDNVLCNIYFHALCCGKKSTEAHSEMMRMKRLGFRPDNVTHNTILKGICKEKSIYEAWTFFHDIDWSQGGPDLISYKTILSAARKWRNHEIISKIIDRMEREGFKPGTFS